MITTTTIVNRRTRKGAENYITGSLGYEAGEWFEDDYWNGQERVPVRTRFTVNHLGPKQFAVVREVEKR